MQILEKIDISAEIPKDFSGIVKYRHGTTRWFKDGVRHREDGPASIDYKGHRSWWLKGKHIWSDGESLGPEIILLSKEPHPEYPTVQIWKFLWSEGIYNQPIIQGMEGIYY